jgi:hypothetical protein
LTGALAEPTPGTAGAVWTWATAGAGVCCGARCAATVAALAARAARAMLCNSARRSALAAGLGSVARDRACSKGAPGLICMPRHLRYEF